MGEKSRAEGAEKRNGTEAGEMQEKEGRLAKREGMEGEKEEKKLTFCKTCKMLVKVLKNKDFYRGSCGCSGLWSTPGNPARCWISA